MPGTTCAPKKQNDRRALIAQLRSYKGYDRAEAACIDRFLDLLDNPRCFYRDCFPGHITGSSVLLNRSGDKILLNHHKFLNKWVCFGGHADGEENIRNVALRETEEESGLTDFTVLTDGIADIDIHPVPANPVKGEPAHEHYDIRYIMRMNSDREPVLSDESLDLQWVTFNEALRLIPEKDGLRRLLAKTKRLAAL